MIRRQAVLKQQAEAMEIMTWLNHGTPTAQGTLQARLKRCSSLWCGEAPERKSSIAPLCRSARSHKGFDSDRKQTSSPP